VSPTGQTADGSWEVGVRRTLPLDLDEAWNRALAVIADDPAAGEATSITQTEVARFPYTREGWPRHSTLQLRVIPAAAGTTVAFHHDRLPGAATREQMHDHWLGVLDDLGR
jgi:hypothetical protein